MRWTVDGRTAASRWISAPLLLVLVVTGCGGEPAAPPVPGSAPAAATVGIDVYLLNETLGSPCTEVFPVPREVDADDPVTGALQALLAGPTDAELAEAYGSWFPTDDADVLLDVEVVDRTAHVTFARLPELAPGVPSSCRASGLLAQLDATLLALEGIDGTAYALADRSAFYGWLQRPDPDAAGPVAPEAATPDEADATGVDLDAGWTPVVGFRWPVEPGCCSLQTTGPVSPDGPIPAAGWPTDGFYDVEVRRTPRAPTELTVTLQRWVACTAHPELFCGDLPDGAQQDTRVIGDPSSAVTRTVPLDELGAVLVPLAGDVIEGTPGALATLLTAGLDPAYRTWIHDPLVAGSSPEAVQDELRTRSEDPGFPFGRGHCDDEEHCAPTVTFRGPLGTSILPGLSGTDHRWPPGMDGLYDWRTITLEVRDGVPILHLWAGPIAG
jgi:hypothetical protein